MPIPPEILRQAVAHYQKGDFAPAEALTRQALALDPQSVPASSLLGDLLARRGSFDEAIALQRYVVEKMPHSGAAFYNLGNTLKARAHLTEAAACYQTAVDLEPGLSQAYNNLGNVLQLLGQTDTAIRVLHEALRLTPHDPLAHNNLGHALKAALRLPEAEASYRKAISLAPSFAEAWNNLAEICHLTGHGDEALACVQKACDLAPANPVMRSNLLNIQLFHPATTTTSLRAGLDDWQSRFAAGITPINGHANQRNPDRKLRIGWVSPDFRDHVVGRNILPWFMHYNRAQFDALCYSNSHTEDRLTQRFRSLATEFTPVAGMRDEELAQRITADGIDILVDLALHLGNRLLVFARKAAPVQVTFAGYPGSTGLNTMDYRLTDPCLDPPGSDADYCETSIRLPSFWCFDPLEPSPAPNALPAFTQGHVTFGCLNNFCKVNPVIVALWARVLSAVPESRLLLLADRGAHREALLRQMQALGVAPQRISFAHKRPRQDYLELYHQIDLSLDTLPYNGHTTSLDGLYMGVPVLSMPGQTVVGRGGVSLLSNLGLTEFLARDTQEYVAYAAHWAQNLNSLAEIRGNLRERMEKSVLMNGSLFARSMQDAFRQMWAVWCRR